MTVLRTARKGGFHINKFILILYYSVFNLLQYIVVNYIYVFRYIVRDGFLTKYEK